MSTIEETATGCFEHPHGLGTFFAGSINRAGAYELETAKDVLDYLFSGGCVAVPSAGAGSYRKFFKSIGCTEVQVYDWTSSAGDWTFAVKLGDLWFAAFQNNRYPQTGFDYSLSSGGVASFEDLCGIMAAAS
jgi:hypothetical protein